MYINFLYISIQSLIYLQFNKLAIQFLEQVIRIGFKAVTGYVQPNSPVNTPNSPPDSLISVFHKIIVLQQMPFAFPQIRAWSMISLMGYYDMMHDALHAPIHRPTFITKQRQGRALPILAFAVVALAARHVLCSAIYIIKHDTWNLMRRTGFLVIRVNFSNCSTSMLTVEYCRLSRWRYVDRVFIRRPCNLNGTISLASKTASNER